ncbi:MAG: two-component regulator propeller domain-containing protein [candidate division WOR-3 bacterium]
MTTTTLLLLLITNIEGTWRSYTHADFVNDITGYDSVIALATTGGIAVIIVGHSDIRQIGPITNSEGLPVNRCLCVTCDPNRNLWVGTDGGGLAVVPHCESARAYLYRPADMPLRIRTLLFDGRKLLVGSDQGLYCVDTRGTYLDFEDDLVKHYSAALTPGLLSDRILSLFCQQGYWIGTNRGVTHTDTTFNHWNPYPRPLGDSVRAMAQLGNKLLVATERGICISESTGFRTLVRFPDVKEVFDIAVHDSDILLATSRGLFLVDTSDSNQITVIRESDSRSVLALDGIWLGTGGFEWMGSGLHYLRSGQAWQVHRLGPLAIFDVNDCEISGTGDIFCCHYSNLITHISGNLVSTIVSPLPNAVMARTDSKGRIWFAHFASEGGLSAYDPATGNWERFQWGVSSDWNIIHAFGLGPDDTKWVFNKAGTVVAVDSLGRQMLFTIPELVPPPGGNYEFAFDSKGRAWLGLTVGLEMIDYGNTLHDPSDDVHKLHVSGLLSTDVRSVAVDRDDNVWVATQQGAAVWDGSSFRTYTVENTGSGLLSNNLFRVRVDAANRVWLLSERGLSVLDLVSGKWESFSRQNSRIIPNIQDISGFYTGLSMNSRTDAVVVSTRRGLSVFNQLPKEDTTLADINVFPNPCIIGIHDRVAIGNLPSSSRVMIYTLTGQLLAELVPDPRLGRAVWKPSHLASGVYPFVALTPQGSIVGKIALVNQ